MEEAALVLAESVDDADGGPLHRGLELRVVESELVPVASDVAPHDFKVVQMELADEARVVAEVVIDRF